MTLVYIAVGVVIGTFIPMPQQEIVRNLFRRLWNRVSEADT